MVREPAAPPGAAHAGARLAARATARLAVPAAFGAAVAGLDAAWWRTGWPTLAAAVPLVCFAAGLGLVTVLAAGAGWALAGVAAVAAGIALATVLPLAAAVLAGLGAGMIAGGAVRHRWRRRDAAREARLAALPDWTRDELGAAAADLDPGYRRDPAAAPAAAAAADPATALLAAVCRPLPGAEARAEAPGSRGRAAVAVHGSRVAVLLRPEPVGPAPAAAEGAAGEGPAGPPPLCLDWLDRLPRGARVALFLLDEGGAAAPRPAELAGPAARAPAPVPVTAAAAQPLAAHLLAGAPAGSDALHGRAADLHDRIRAALAAG